MKGNANMKRFHIHVGVKDLEKSIQFYSTLFGQTPTKLKENYAKWMLEDPRINFAISTLTNETGVDHLGIQVDETKELEELTERLKNADLCVYNEGETTCCYAKSNKAWVSDPSGVAWEAYQTIADADVYKEKSDDSESNCCIGDETDKDPNEKTSVSNCC